MFEAYSLPTTQPVNAAGDTRSTRRHLVVAGSLSLLIGSATVTIRKPVAAAKNVRTIDVPTADARLIEIGIAARISIADQLHWSKMFHACPLGDSALLDSYATKEITADAKIQRLAVEAQDIPAITDAGKATKAVLLRYLVSIDHTFAGGMTDKDELPEEVTMALSLCHDLVGGMV